MSTPPVRRREVFGWAMFDFANSSYTTVIVTVAFSAFYIQALAPEGRGEALWGAAIALSNAIVMLASPAVGAIADGAARKKAFLFASYLACVLGTACLGFAGPGQFYLPLVLVVLSNIAFSFGENLTASFLPEISTPESIGRISGLGWGLGYLGGVACLLAIQPLVAGGYTVANIDNLRRAWWVTAAFFLASGACTFLLLRERAVATPGHGWAEHARAGFARVGQTFRSVRHFQELARFLLAFFFFQAGLASVFSFSGVYVTKTLAFTPREQALLFLAMNLAGALGALLFGWVQDRLGAMVTVRWMLAYWVLVCTAAFLATTKAAFWPVGLAAGLGMGSLQSASRALVGLFAPIAKTAEFFGFWGLAGKGAYVVGPLLFGLLTLWSGSQRVAILSTGAFFALGLVLSLRVNEARGRAAAASWQEPAEAGADAPIV